MAETKISAGPNDSLWKIAQSCGIPGGGSNWQALNVVRNGTTYRLASDDLPGGLQPGDTVVVPKELAHSCQHEVDGISAALGSAPRAGSAAGAAAQAAAAAQPASAVSAAATYSTKVIFVLDPGHGGRAAAPRLVSAATLKPYKDAVAAGTMTQADYNAMFDMDHLSWNNALGAISNTLEKTMTHKLIPLIRNKINAKKAALIAQVPNLTEIEVHLTKEDEYVNMTGADRAGVARDKAADFFFCCHFDAERVNTHVKLDITKVSGTVDPTLNVAIDSLDSKLLGGTYPKDASSGDGMRGPTILYSGHSTSPARTVQNARAVGSAIRTDLAAALQRAEGSARPVTAQGESPRRLANLSPVLLGTTNAKNKQIVPIYLEADFINVESGDRLWNTAAYNAAIGACRTRWGIPPEPADAAGKDAWRSAHLRRQMPALPAGHDMFDKAAEAIATTLLANIHQRIC
ncbi:MAG: N-acetylmuramoyl-L-alanine amidase [Paracoccus sp. (in: a-proteobacteria)]|nr:N-acetylmuramoyl-L-alanine amidase [Paracoccus sp. (in: a-proteobacteria)]